MEKKLYGEEMRSNCRKNSRSIHLLTIVLLAITMICLSLLYNSVETDAATTFSSSIITVKSKMTIKLSKGQNRVLKVAKGKIISAKSSKPAVVKITKKGKVYAKKAGTAKIMIKDTKGRKYTFNIKVENPILSFQSITMKVGETRRITVSGNTRHIQWSSSNETVAHVDVIGTVKAVAPGNAVIKANIAGHYLYCTVKVIASADNNTNDITKSQVVDDRVNDFLTESSNKDLTDDQKGEQIVEMIQNLEKENVLSSGGATIVRESIEYDQQSKTCFYVDENNILYSYAVNTEDTLSLTVNSNTALNMTDLVNSENRIYATGIILFGLDSSTSKAAAEYKAYAEKLGTSGLKCDVDVDVTVQDYKTKLNDVDIAIIETHGNTWEYRYGFANSASKTVPILVTKEVVTSSNQNNYQEDLRNQRIAIWNVETGKDSNGKSIISKRYIILPSFFEYYYSNNNLSGEYIHVGSCRGFGGDVKNQAGTIERMDNNYELARAFVNSGASDVTGYYNSVFTAYDQSICSETIQSLLKGNKLKDALAAAKMKYGQNDKEYAQKVGWLQSESSAYKTVMEKFNTSGISSIDRLGSGEWKVDMTDMSFDSWRAADVSYGDINNDGKIDDTDSTLLLQHIAVMKSESIYDKHPDWALDKNQQIAADVDGDGEISMGDDILVLRHIESVKNNTTTQTRILTIRCSDNGKIVLSKPILYKKDGTTVYYGSLPDWQRMDKTRVFNGWTKYVSSSVYITKNTPITNFTNHTIYAHWN